MQPLSPGKLRCLQQLTNVAGVFGMVAIDHRDVFVGALSQTLGVSRADWATVAAEKTRLAKALGPHATGIVLDPLYSAGPVIARGALPGRVPFAVAREKSGYRQNNAGRATELLDNWSVEATRRLGGSAVKLLLYYHPDSETAARQEAVVEQVAAECAAHDLAFMLEPICYPLDPTQPKDGPVFAKRRPELIVEAALRLVPLGVDILKAEFPTDAHYETDETTMYDHCYKLSEAAAGVPWVLLSAGVDFHTFQRQVEIACEAGASGFVAGRAVWREVLETADEAARQTFLDTMAVSRLRVLGEVATYRATPWFERVAGRVPSLQEGWYQNY